MDLASLPVDFLGTSPSHEQGDILRSYFTAVEHLNHVWNSKTFPNPKLAFRYPPVYSMGFALVFHD
jgi:hypothetical protein